MCPTDPFVYIRGQNNPDTGSRVVSVVYLLLVNTSIIEEDQRVLPIVQSVTSPRNDAALVMVATELTNSYKRTPVKLIFLLNG